MIGTLIGCHTRFHGWRIFAGEELGITLDELLQITMSGALVTKMPIVTYGTPALSERLCEITIKSNQRYLDLVPMFVEYRGEGDEELDLETRAQEFADEMAEAVDFS